MGNLARFSVCCLIHAPDREHFLAVGNLTADRFSLSCYLWSYAVRLEIGADSWAKIVKKAQPEVSSM